MSDLANAHRAISQLHTGVIRHLERNGTAFANANGYTNSDQRNAIVHAHRSAETAYDWGRGVAEALGNSKEWGQPGNSRDSWKDQWNNEVGRQMAEWAKAQGYAKDIIDRLMLDALTHGDLIIDPTDPRIGLHDFDGDGNIDLYVPPEPHWEGPHEWYPNMWGTPDDPLRPRDYSGIPDPFGDLGDYIEERYKDFRDWIDDAYDRALEGLGEAKDWLKGLYDLIRDILSDPIVLDLDGDGIELTSLASSATMFDLDDDGVAERTGWVSPHDGLLVHDANRNGTVDGVGELFGSANVDGYDELKTIDANNDGRIDALDPAFAELRVWRDLNSDGVSSADEMLTLAEAGIARFNLAYSQIDADMAGNVVARKGSYVRADGTTRATASVQFAGRTMRSRRVPASKAASLAMAA